MIYLNAITLSILMAFFGIEDGLKVGDQAVDFNLRNIDGSMVSLAADTGAKGYILIFTCNTCPY